MIQYLHMDCEMGGRELKYSLLTAYFMVTDSNFNVLDELFLRVKPDDGTYIVSGQGMSVNQIDLREHDRIAIPYKNAKPFLFNFLKRNAAKGLLTPSGHGVRGDVDHVIDKLISEGSWQQFCTYHFIDTSVVLQFLRACGKMPADCDGSVKALAQYFNIPIEGKLHECDVDTKLQAEVLRHFVKLGQEQISGILGQ